jgi:hypothetical protein
MPRRSPKASAARMSASARGLRSVFGAASRKTGLPRSGGGLRSRAFTKPICIIGYSECAHCGTLSTLAGAARRRHIAQPGFHRAPALLQVLMLRSGYVSFAYWMGLLHCACIWMAVYFRRTEMPLEEDKVRHSHECWSISPHLHRDLATSAPGPRH